MHAMGLVQSLETRANRRRNSAPDQAIGRLHHRDLATALAGGCGHLKADEPTADDGDARPLAEGRRDGG